MDKMKEALLVIDMQKASYSGFSKESMDKAVVTINRAVDIFRQTGRPIVWIQDEEGHTLDSESYQIIDALKPLDSEKRISKLYMNSFNKTGLLEYLTDLDVDTVIVTGYNAVYCVLSTYRGALDNDLTPKILKGAIASESQENITFAEKLCENMVGIDSLE
jgi:nicotinamidase-related amidase